MASYDPQRQNELNYLAWKRENAQRKRDSRTQFNMWRDHQNERMYNHQLYKTMSEDQTDKLKDMMQRRLSTAAGSDGSMLSDTEEAVQNVARQKRSEHTTRQSTYHPPTEVERTDDEAHKSKSGSKGRFSKLGKKLIGHQPEDIPQQSASRSTKPASKQVKTASKSSKSQQPQQQSRHHLAKRKDASTKERPMTVAY